MHYHCGFLCIEQSKNHFKKTQIRYSEADEGKRETFKKDLAELESKHPDKSLFYVDETGIDKHIYRPNVRAARGQKIYSKIRGQKFERLSIVAGKCKDKTAAPMVFKGTADSALFEYWFESCFCPEIAGNIAILDNASIHRKEKLYKIAQKYNVILIFQPPYSPDLNKIEKFWAWLKKQLRSALKIFDTLFDAICYCFQLK